MSHLLYLKKGDEPSVPFKLHEYAEPYGGRLHGPTTLAELRLATLEMKEPGTNVYVRVAFHTGTELSIDCFTANSEDTPLAVRGEGVAGAAGAAGVAGAAGAAASTSASWLSEDAVVQLLVQRFGGMFTTRKASSTRATQLYRGGRIPVKQGQVVLNNFGRYLALAGYEPAVDALVTVLLQLQGSFTTSDTVSFATDVQLLRLAGAPGTGKTTFASAAWDLVLLRMQQVQRHDPAKWAEWEAEYDPQQLLQRLQDSWGGQHGPLAFVMDMSQQDYMELNPMEAAECTCGQQVAARMLWSALNTAPAGILTYGAFLYSLKTAPQPLLRFLTPQAVQRFVLRAAGVQDGATSMQAWVWDEVNAVKLERGQETTFCQEHLSIMVGTRVSMQSQYHSGGVNLLPVLVTCTTRGSSTSLALTASKKARVLDLQVPLREELEGELPLVFMDLLRRLDPLPPPIAVQLQSQGISRTASLSELSAEQRAALAELCPQHVRNALEWAGGNMRSATHLVSAVSGQPEGETGHLRLGSLEWWHPSKARPLGQVVNILVNHMEQAGWRSWLVSDGLNYPLMVELTAYSLCNMPLARSFELRPSTWSGGAVTLEHLERDGVVQLVSTGERLEIGQQPDDIQKQLVLPPALLAAYLRRVQRPGLKGPVGTLQLVQGMMEASRVREHDDLTITLLRLHMFGDVLGKRAVTLHELLPSFADTDLAMTYVQIPETGFVPTYWRQDLSQGVLQQLVEAAVASADAPWCWLLGGSCGPDSWIVLRKSDAGGECTGGCVVLHLQSKLTVRDTAYSWKMVMEEVRKVQPTWHESDVTEVLAIITDHRPPKQAGHRPSSGSSSGGSSSSDNSPSSNKALPWQQLLEGRAAYLEDQRIWVTVVFREQQWQVRGGAVLLYDLLRLGSDMVEQHLPSGDSPYDHPMLLARKSGKRGRPKLKPRPEAIDAWLNWQEAHHKKQEA